MSINGILYTLCDRLEKFKNEEKILGRHMNLDYRTAAMVIQMAEELAELRVKPKFEEVWRPVHMITITLWRNNEPVVYKFTEQPLIYGSKTPGFTPNPDANGLTWYMRKETCITEPQVRIPLEPHEGPLLRRLVYEDNH